MGDPIRDRVDENLKHLTSAVERKGEAMTERTMGDAKSGMTDHARGCEGRSYTCTCGYDAERDAALTALREENERLRTELADADALIKAQQHDFAANNIRNAEDAARATAAEARLAEAMKVMEPFAEEARAWENYDDSEPLVEDFPSYYGLPLRVCHLRAAHAFIEKEKSNG